MTALDDFNVDVPEGVKADGAVLALSAINEGIDHFLKHINAVAKDKPDDIELQKRVDTLRVLANEVRFAHG